MTDDLRALPIGYVLSDYRIDGVLGHGGFGITYLATDTMLNRRVAIKEYFPREFAVRDGTLLVRAAGNKEDRETFSWGLKRFLDEARVLALFDHPNIVAVRRFFESNGTAYLVMDYCDGVPLDELIKRDGPLSPLQINRILLPILDGLERVHSANFLHRDIKPANIFIRSDGSPVLLDFGAARQEIVSHSKSVTSLATPGYAAFEQYSTHGKQGPWTDIYGLGATLYRAITGEKPQDAPDRILEDTLVPITIKAAAGFDMRILNAIDAAMSVRPKQRPQSISEWRGLLGLNEAIVKQTQNHSDKTIVISPPIQPAIIQSEPHETEKKVLPKTVQTDEGQSQVKISTNKSYFKTFLIASGIVLVMGVGYLISRSSDNAVVAIKPTTIPGVAGGSSSVNVSPSKPVTPQVDQTPIGQSQKITNCIGTNTSSWTNCIGTQAFASDSQWSGQKYIGSFVDGKRSGDGTYIWPNGDKYIGQFKNNAPNGIGTFTWSDGTSYVGGFKDGLKHGSGTQTLPKGGKYVGDYRNDLMEGKGTIYKPDGSVAITGVWVKGEYKKEPTIPLKSELSTTERMALCNRGAEEINKTPNKPIDNITVIKSASCYMKGGVPTFIYTYGVLGNSSSIGQQQISAFAAGRIKQWCSDKTLKPLLDIFNIEDRYVENGTGHFLGQNSFGPSDCK